MADDFKYDVFLSYSLKDKSVVRPIAERLRADGLRVWFDEAGNSTPAEIEEGLEHSRVLVLCMSANAFGSDWAQLESYTFRFRDPLNKNRRFIPLRFDEVPVKGSLTQFLYINWLPEDREQAYAKLLEACRKDRQANESQEEDGWCHARPEDVIDDSNARHNFAAKIKDTLARRVGMRCSNPACRKLTSGPQSDPRKALNIGVAAHITAASAGGPRYASSISKRERSSIENGIWLCQNCAKLVDNNVDRYTVVMLQEWKKDAENEALRQVQTSGATVIIDSNPHHFPKRLETTEAQIEMLAASPFHPIGAMPLETKSYISRVCDGDLKKAAESQTFIWLQGDFLFGKTSLLRRHHSWLTGDWSAIYVDLVLCDPTTEMRFRRDFFAEIKERWRPESSARQRLDWRVLRDLSINRKTAFILDEIGHCKDKQIKEVIEGFRSLADWAPGRIKLVVAYREDPMPFLQHCGIQNPPKRTDPWKIVRLTPFTLTEVNRLIDLLPASLSKLIHARIERLRALTHFEPQQVQYLLHNLWEVFRASEGKCEATETFIDAWLDSEEAQ